MYKKIFEGLAAAVASIDHIWIRREICNLIGEVCAANNPRFSWEIWKAACNVIPRGVKRCCQTCESVKKDKRTFQVYRCLEHRNVGPLNEGNAGSLVCSKWGEKIPDKKELKYIRLKPGESITKSEVKENTVEWCPVCENEVVISDSRASVCPGDNAGIPCRTLLLPCSACMDADNSSCDWAKGKGCRLYPSS